MRAQRFLVNAPPDETPIRAEVMFFFQLIPVILNGTYPVSRQYVLRVVLFPAYITLDILDSQCFALLNPFCSVSLTG